MNSIIYDCDCEDWAGDDYYPDFHGGDVEIDSKEASGVSAICSDCFEAAPNSLEALPALIDQLRAATALRITESYIARHRATWKNEVDRHFEELLHKKTASKAVERIEEILAAAFPLARYDASYTPGGLAARIQTGFQENKAVIVGFVEKRESASPTALYTIHLIELVGREAILERMEVRIKTPSYETWHAEGNLPGPVRLCPFGRMIHTWKSASPLLEESDVQFVFQGYCRTDRVRAVSVKI